MKMSITILTALAVFGMTGLQHADGATVGTSQPTYEFEEPIVVNFSGAPGNALDWIGLYPAGAPDGSYIAWLYTDGTQAGTPGITDGSVTFAGLGEGDYEVRLFLDNGYTLLASGSFQVLPPPQRIWTNADLTDDLWCTAGNWNTGVVPGPLDNAIISPPPNRGPVVDSACNVHVRHIYGPTYDSDLDQVMDITGGTIVVDNSWMWASHGTGNANLNISGNPTINVGGRWRGIDNGSGVLNISGTPVINVGTYWKVADGSDAFATVNVSGGTINVGRYFRLGEDGSGEVNISGGTINLPEGFQAMGNDPASNVTVDITGSPTINASAGGGFNDTWRVANEGTCILNISGSPTIIANGAFRGADGCGSYFEVNMDGGHLSAEDLLFGDDGVGLLNMNGGIIDISGNMRLGGTRGSGGTTVNMNGGSINVTGELRAPNGTGLLSCLGQVVINLDGGTIECGAFSHTYDGWHMDVKEGVLIIAGDVTAEIQVEIAAGRITAYDGTCQPQVDFDNINPGKTTVFRSPPVASSGGPYIALATSWDGATVQLDGTGSGDAQAGLTYSWDLDLWLDSDGDGDATNDPDSTEAAPSPLFPIGQREISLVVTNLCGLSSEPDVTNVTVSWIEVSVDIKPGSFPNAINLGSHGTIPVAFLSDEDFDARSINPGSVTLRGIDFDSGLIAMRGKKDAQPMASHEDVDGDGDVDLMVHLDTEKLAEFEGELQALVTLGALTFDGYVASGTDTVRIKNLTAFKVDIGAEGQEVEPGFIGWSPPPAGDPSGDTVLLDIAGTGINAKLETGLGNDDLGFRGPGIVGVRPYQGQNYLANDFLHPDNYGGGKDVVTAQCPGVNPTCEPGTIILTLSNVPAGQYQLTGYHNEPRLENHSGTPDDIGVSPLNVRISGAVSGATGDTDVIVTGRDTNAGIGQSTSTFTATGDGDVIIEFEPDGSLSGPSATDPSGIRNLWDRAWLNGFELRSQ